MKIAPTLVMVSVALLGVSPASAAAPDAGGARSLAAALKGLETARANLAQAVHRVEKDPPSTADLDAAHAAVGVLKDAIDAGADHEAEDLDYAKAALTARKELRTQREYVDDRRAKVYIHDQRRATDLAIATLGDRVHKLEGKEPTPQDFDDARAAAAALKKTVDDGRQFTKQDEKFAAYVGQVDATLARQSKAIDDRWTVLSADKQRALVKESLQALSASMGALTKGATDAQFEDAGRAASALSKRLEEGKPLEAKDKAYRADAERARTELAQAKKRTADLLNETSLARLKSQIDPAYKDLVAAGRAVRTKSPTPDQLAEARTATIIVRKLVEKYEPQATLSPAFGQYVTEVKRVLVDVEVELQRRNLDSARKDLVQAVKNLERQAPTDEQFEEAKTAQVILEKTLENVHDKDPALAAQVNDARALVQDARTTIPQRRLQVDVRRQRAKVEDARKNAATLMGQLAGPNGGNDAVAQAEKGVQQIGAALDEGSALIPKDREYAAYDGEVRKRISELNERIANRRLVLAVGVGRAQLTDTIAAAKAKLDAAKQPAATAADLDAAARSVETVNKAIEGQTPLEKQDKGYAAHAEKARAELERLNETLDFAKQAHALRQQTADALAAGTAAADSATGRDLRSQKERYDKALAQFRSCESAGERMVKDNRALANIVVLVAGSPSTPKDVAALCEQKTKATEQLLAQVVPLLAFEDGPKRAYEAGKALLAKGKKTEALDQFYECISSGLILQNRSPELKDHPFQIEATKMTIAELVEQCTHHRDAIKAK